MPAKTPEQVAAVERLKRWATSPEGYRHFRWGTCGDWKRCRRFYKGKMPNRMIPGFCQDLHKRATGMYTGATANTAPCGGRGSKKKR